MYERAKQILKVVVPTGLLRRLSPYLRSVNALCYAGNAVFCPCCTGRFARWVVLANGERLCPRCGSLPRGRRLFGLLDKEYLRPGATVLHFSPSASLSRVLSRRPIRYEPSDYLGEFTAPFAYDITAIDAPDGKYDLVICYHVLEHIVPDTTAMGELYRVLADGGTCLVQTPFREGAIYEDYGITEPAERKIAFGQDDHVRVYSAEGLAGRLGMAGFRVEVRAFAEDEVLGLRGGERVLRCSKPPHPQSGRCKDLALVQEVEV